MTNPKVLISHTYIGTLIEACKQESCDILASQEVAGFGSDIQAANWPEVKIIPKRDNWLQKSDLPSDTNWFMIAHPPCAGGSMVTPTHARGGLDNPKSAFHVTHDFMKYAYSMNPPIIAVESVPGTLRECGADLRKMRDMYAPHYGVAFVLDTSQHHGCASIRKRLWHIHYRRDLFPNGIEWVRNVEPKLRTVRDALQGASEAADFIVSPVQQKTYDKFSNLWPAMDQGSYANNWLRKTGRWDMVDPNTIKTKTNGEKFVFYESVASKRLAWDQPAPTITGSTLLIHPDGTRPLTTREYLRINGMPDTFSFPPSVRPGNHITYIGKTVSLGIALWVVQNIKLNIASLQKESSL